jgi:hypothetical protein
VSLPQFQLYLVIEEVTNELLFELVDQVCAVSLARGLRQGRHDRRKRAS